MNGMSKAQSSSCEDLLYRFSNATGDFVILSCNAFFDDDDDDLLAQCMQRLPMTFNELASKAYASCM